MKWIIALFLLLGLAQIAIGQTVRGIVRDSMSRAPLPYVHIGVPNKDMGVISRDDGSFQINLSKATSSDSLTFSTVGYQSYRIPLPVQSPDSLNVHLVPVADTLREIRVEASRLSNPVKLGRYKPTKITTGYSGSGDFGFGGEWGIRINHHGQTYRIADVRFHTRFNTLDSALFRINIYRVQDSLPHESLLRRPLLVKSYRRDKWITKDVWDERLIVGQDIVVSYEVLQLWRSPRGNNALFFTHGEDYEPSQTYRRASSLDRWQIQDSFPATLYLTVEGYEPTIRR